MIFLNFGMGLMSSDDSKLKVQFTDVFKRQVRDLAKRYRRIKLDIQPILDWLAIRFKIRAIQCLTFVSKIVIFRKVKVAAIG